MVSVRSHRVIQSPSTLGALSSAHFYEVAVSFRVPFGSSSSSSSIIISSISSISSSSSSSSGNGGSGGRGRVPALVMAPTVVLMLVMWCWCSGVVDAGNPDAKRLYDDLLSNYNKIVRPVVNNSDVLTVRIKLKLSQLIDLVSCFPAPL